MSVERRRTIALAGTALLVAGALGLYVASDRLRSDSAVTVIEADATAAPAPPTAVEATTLEPPPEAPPEATSEAAAEPTPAPVAPEAPQSAAAPVLARAADAAPAREAARDPAPVAEPARTVAAVDPALIAPDQEAREPAAPEPAAAPVVAPAQPDAVFDIVRVEPTGDAVIAGRAGPGERVELLRNGAVHDVVVADATGAFAFLPPPLPPGTHEITLQVRAGDEAPRRSRESVTVVVDAGLADAPIVALATPDAPTRILSRPEPAAPVAEPAPSVEPAAAAEAAPDPAPADDRPPAAAATSGQTQLAHADAAGPIVDRRAIRVATVEAESGGGLYVSGEGAPNSSVRLYLNETFVGRASADHAGAISFAISRGVRPGLYRVRLDDIDPRDGAVLSRAEVEFEMPQALVATAPDPQPAEARETAAPPATLPAREPAPSPAPAASSPKVAAVAPGGEAPAPAGLPAETIDVAGAVSAEPQPEPAREATLVIPEVNTALVSRGDSLWRISRRVYGAGVRYTVIFDANSEQIRDPDLIFPGQIFVLPGEAALEETAER